MILTDDEGLAAKARYLTTQAKDDEIKYIHNEIGYNFRLTNIQAALGVAQLEQLDGFIERKKEIYNRYKSGLDNHSNFSIADIPDYADNNHWLTVLKTASELKRDDAFKNLTDNSIQTRPVWCLNHLQKPYLRHQFFNIENAVTLYNNSLCLPSSVTLGGPELNLIVGILNG